MGVFVHSGIHQRCRPLRAGLFGGKLLNFNIVLCTPRRIKKTDPSIASLCTADKYETKSEQDEFFHRKKLWTSQIIYLRLRLCKLWRESHLARASELIPAGGFSPPQLLRSTNPKPRARRVSYLIWWRWRESNPRPKRKCVPSTLIVSPGYGLVIKERQKTTRSSLRIVVRTPEHKKGSFQAS